MTEYPSFPATAASQLARHLTRDRWEALKDTRSEAGWSLADLCRSGLENPDSSCGVYAGDADCYRAFAPLLDAVLEDLGRGRVSLAPEPPGDLGPEVVSTRVRAARNLAGHRFPAAQTREERERLAARVRAALEELPPPWKGSFQPLEDLGEGAYGFDSDDRFMRAAGFFGDWPAGRGVFRSQDERFLVWVGEEDHLRVIALQPGGDLAAVWGLVSGALERLDAALGFAVHPEHGTLASCPTNTGGGVRASVHLPLPRLATNPSGLAAQAKELGLQLRGTGGEHTAAEGGVYDLSVKVRVGLPVDQQLTALQRGVAALRDAERAAA